MIFFLIEWDAYNMLFSWISCFVIGNVAVGFGITLKTKLKCKTMYPELMLKQNTSSVAHDHEYTIIKLNKNNTCPAVESHFFYLIV